MKVGVLAVQGAFAEHIKILESLGVTCVELRDKKDLEQDYQGLVLPGGESTVQGKLLRELDMFQTLQEQIQKGLPVLATCAGLILLAKELSNDSRSYFQTLPVKVKRNAYGRQLGSFVYEGPIKHIGNFPMRFIRAPYIESYEANVEILATYEGHIVGVQFEKQIGLAFHPEITTNTKVHEWFLSNIN